MTSPSKIKGSRIEREIVELHKEANIPAKKVPLSGMLGGEHSGDVIVAETFRCEVKARKNGQGFATISKWLGENDILFLREDRMEPKVVLPWGTYMKLLAAWYDRSI